jgi:hypothetical protein
VKQINILRELYEDNEQIDWKNPRAHVQKWKDLSIKAKAHGLNDEEIKMDGLIWLLFLRSIHEKYETTINHYQEDKEMSWRWDEMSESLENVAGRWEMAEKEVNIISKRNGASANSSRDNGRKFCTLCNRNHFAECAKMCENCKKMHYGTCRLLKTYQAVAEKTLEVIEVYKIFHETGKIWGNYKYLAIKTNMNKKNIFIDLCLLRIISTL